MMPTPEVGKTLPLEEVIDPFLIEAGVSIKVLRCDLIDLITGGNKWFKLHLNLEDARRQGINTLLSFGGCYSNHLAALAQMGVQNGFKTIGIVRGEPTSIQNNTLSRASKQGMQLVFTERDEFRKWRSEEGWTELEELYKPCIIIPEGGSNSLGVQGCMKLADFIPSDTDDVFLPVGTGATLAGLVLGLKGKSFVTGIAVVKAASYLDSEVKKFLDVSKVYLPFQDANDSVDEEKYILDHTYTFGGYAKGNPILDKFITDFNNQHHFTIEKVYSGKLWFGIYDLILKGKVKKGTKIVVIHTGGLQYLHS